MVNIVYENSESIDWIAVIALIVSTSLLIYQIYKELFYRRKELESSIFLEIYKDTLLFDIPKARRAIGYSENRIIGTDEIIETISQLRKQSTFYQYADKDFYKEVLRLSEEIEDEFVVAKDMRDNEYRKFIQKMDNRFSTLYKLLMSKYRG